MTDQTKPTRPSFECCFCNTLTYSNFCMDCSVKIANNHDSILKFLIGMYPDAEPLKTYKQQPNKINPPNNTVPKQQNSNILIVEPKNTIITIKKTDAEKKREWRAKKKEEIGEEEFRQRATAEKRIQRTGTADAKHLLTPEEKLERRQLSDKKYQEKQKAKKEQQ